MPKKTDPRIGKIIITKKQIELATNKAARWIDKNYQGKNPLLISVLQGSVPFFAKVLNKIKIDVQIDFVCYSSYAGNITQIAKPKMVVDLHQSITNRHVIVIDDICDTGKTLLFFKKLLEKRHPASLKFMVMGDKKEGRTVEFKPDYVCFNIPNIWVIGFGFNYHSYLRNLPYIATLNPRLVKEELAKHKNKKI